MLVGVGVVAHCARSSMAPERRGDARAASGRRRLARAAPGLPSFSATGQTALTTLPGDPWDGQVKATVSGCTVDELLCAADIPTYTLCESKSFICELPNSFDDSAW